MTFNLIISVGKEGGSGAEAKKENCASKYRDSPRGSFYQFCLLGFHLCIES